MRGCRMVALIVSSLAAATGCAEAAPPAATPARDDGYDAALRAGVESYGARDFAAAREQLERASALRPGEAMPHHWLALIGQLELDHDACVRHADEYARLAPDGDAAAFTAKTGGRCRAQLTSARSLSGLGDRCEQQARAIVVTPFAARAWARLAECAAAAEQWSMCRAIVDDARAVPLHSKLHIRWACAVCRDPARPRGICELAGFHEHAFDRDRDGIPNRLDRCPRAAENVNGLRDLDGCPD